jgi:hypothetical protein
MNTFNDSLLITSAPTEILVGLGIFFCIVGLILFALSIAEGNYPEFLRRIKRVGMINAWIRRERSHWLFDRNACHPVVQGNHYERYL